MKSNVGTWWFDIVDYFRFVNARRIDRHHPLMPQPLASVVGLLVCSVIIICLFIWADPLLLEWVRQPDRQYPWIFDYITLLGKVDWILVPTGVVLIVISLTNAKRFSGRKIIVWHRLFLNAYFIFTATIFSGLLGILLKNGIGRARPRFTPLGDIWSSDPFGHHYQFASFPSGHATTAGAITMALALLFPRWRWFFIAAGLVVAISRPVLGVHFPSDVAGGLIFGGGFVWFYARSFARKRLLFKFSAHGKLELRGEGKRSTGIHGK